MNKSIQLKKVILASMFIALGIILPFLTGNNRELGNALSLMHIPVLLAGLILGWQYGLVVGLVTPILRSLTIGMPPMMPIALAMMFELTVYGALIGLFYKLLPKRDISVQLSLIFSMIIGRLVWGLAAWVFYPLAGWDFTLQIFLISAFVTALPGIVVQLILIPILFIRLKDYGILNKLESNE